MSLHRNRVSNAVSGTPGTGTITLGSAVTGFQSFSAAYGANATVDVLIIDGNAWEVARSCTYTHSGTTLTRGTLEASSTGSTLSLTSAATVSVIPTADWGNRVEATMLGVTPGGRLTLTSGVPVPTSDVTGATSVFYTPFVHNTIALWDGVDWRPITFAETTLALGTLISGRNYDVFGFLSGGALSLELLSWTDNTTRATAITLQDGRYCLSGNKTRLYLGTFRTTSTTTTEDSRGGTTTQVGGKRFLWNAYNREPRSLAVMDFADSWSYTTDTIRVARGATAPLNCVEFVCGLPISARAWANGIAFLQSNSARAAKVGIGVNTVTAMSGTRAGGYNTYSSPGLYAPVGGAWSGQLSAGYHYLAWLEKGADGACTFLGDNGGDDQQAGVLAEVFA